MLVFSPMALPHIYQSLITDFRPSLRNAEPANALYMLTRFACLSCDDNWVEDLIIGATDAIEDVFFVSDRASHRARGIILSGLCADPCRRSDLPDILVVQHHRLVASHALRQGHQPDMREFGVLVVDRGDSELRFRWVHSS